LFNVITVPLSNVTARSCEKHGREKEIKKKKKKKKNRASKRNRLLETAKGKHEKQAKVSSGAPNGRAIVTVCKKRTMHVLQ
jgi:hypothetical protein